MFMIFKLSMVNLFLKKLKLRKIETWLASSNQCHKALIKTNCLYQAMNNDYYHQYSWHITMHSVLSTLS